MPNNWIATLDPVFSSIRESIQRIGINARKEADELRARLGELEHRLAATETMARDALSAVDVAHAEVELIRQLYSTQTREMGELVRHLVHAPPREGGEGAAHV